MTAPIDYGTILSIRFPDRQWTVTGESYADIEWHDDGPVPTEAELATMARTIVAEAAAREAEQVALRQSGIDKLANLGLTEAEVLAMLGSAP